MNADQTQPAGPDLTKGIDAALLADGAMLLGHIGQDPVILARSGGEVFAIGAICSHYGGPLAEGLLVGDTVRCPWHHACFSMRTGEAVRAPALNPVACWSVETIDGRHFVRRHELPSRAARLSSAGTPASIVILGGGAAAEAALETLGERDTAGVSQCSARTRRHLTIDQICQRISSPAPQARNGFRCGMRSSIGKTMSTSGLAYAQPR